MFKLSYPESYLKRAKRFLQLHPQLSKQYEKTLKLLELNPYHPSLRLHALSGRLKGLHSVSINVSYRITLDLIIKDKEILLVNIGDHETVY